MPAICPSCQSSLGLLGNEFVECCPFCGKPVTEEGLTALERERGWQPFRDLVGRIVLAGLAAGLGKAFGFDWHIAFFLLPAAALIVLFVGGAAWHWYKDRNTSLSLRQ